MLDEGNPRTYPSQIQDLDENEMFVAVPAYRGAPVHVGIGSEITVSSLVSGARYMGTATVLAREFIPVEALKLVRPETVQRVQFRENFRVEIHIPECVVHAQPADDPSVTEELEAEITNFSAGGARFTIVRNVPTSKGSPSVKYWLEFPLDFENPLGDVLEELPDLELDGDDEDEEPAGPDIMSMPIRIIGVDQVGDGRTESFLVRSQFISPPTPAQDRITRFVDLCQMALRRRRLT